MNTSGYCFRRELADLISVSLLLGQMCTSVAHSCSSGGISNAGVSSVMLSGSSTIAAHAPARWRGGVITCFSCEVSSSLRHS